jgi:hypothetical protein
MRHEVPADVIARLADVYHDEIADLAAYTDLASPVFYRPRFRNLHIA